MAANQEAINVLAKYLRPVIVKAKPPSISEFAKTKFYIPETGYPLTLMPHQEAILNYAFDPVHGFQTIVYSTVKKSGKTCVASLAARWITETWGNRNEIYCFANDLEQARGRIYQKAIDSVELNPAYNKVRKELPGEWKVVERQGTYLPTGSIIRAVSGDYKGEAGSNPTATFWSELWGYVSEASKRLWEELTPVPTRERSIRFVETYAGYEGESELLIELYNRGVKEGRRLTHDDIYWPFPDQPPIYVNEAARQFTYWDDGPIARRMPWQTPEYYAAQEATLRPQAFQRLHLNYWTSSVSPFMPIEWWDGCSAPVHALDKHTPIVVGADAAVSSDCCALVGVSRHPQNSKHIAVRLSRVWSPPKGGTIDLETTMGDTIREWAKQYNIVEVAYDAYQLHNLMTNLTKEEVAWCRPFSQMGERSKADKQLYDLIRDRKLVHSGDDDIREHLKNSAAKLSKEEDSKMRIIKKSADHKIDLVVAMSMATAECLRLTLD
jgi:phage terminase large subunit-like protein